MVEDGSDDLRLEVCLDKSVRSAEVIIPIINKHVAEGQYYAQTFEKHIIAYSRMRMSIEK